MTPPNEAPKGMPSEEQLTAWAEHTHTCGWQPDLAAFLRSPLLADALDLWEAVAWCAQNSTDLLLWEKTPGRIGWTASYDAQAELCYGETIPEAVRALREKMEEA